MLAYLLDLQLLSLPFLAGQQDPLQLCVDEQVFPHVLFVLAEVVAVAHHHLRKPVLIAQLPECEVLQRS